MNNSKISPLNKEKNNIKQKAGNKISSGNLLAKNSVFNLMGSVLPLLVGIIAMPFAIKGLGKDGFGVLSIAWVVLGYFGLFDFGLSRATTKFVAEALSKNDEESIPSIVWTAVFVSIIFGILGTIILVFITPYLAGSLLNIPDALLSEAKKSFYILAFALPVIICSTSLRGVLGGAQRFDLVNYVLIPAGMLSFIFPGLAFPLHLSLPTVLFLMILSRAAAALAYLFLSFKVFPVLRKRPTLSIEMFKKMISYGGWVTVTNIISPLLVYLDRFFIGALISITFVTFYSAPYEIIVRLRILPVAIMTSLFPEFSASAIRADQERIGVLFARAMKYIFIVVGTAVILIYIYSFPILQIWLGAEFAKSSLNVLRILAFGILLNSLAFVPFVLLQGVGRPDLPAKFHLIELPVYLFLLIYLVKSFGIDGAAWAWTIRGALDAILLFGRVIKLYPNIFIHLKCERIILVFPYLLSLYLMLFSSNIFCHDIYSKISTFCLIMFVFSIFTWRYIIDESEKNLIKLIVFKLAKR